MLWSSSLQASTPASFSKVFLLHSPSPLALNHPSDLLPNHGLRGCEWEAISEPAGPSVPQNRSGVWHRPGTAAANRNHLLGLCFELHHPLPPWAEEYRTQNPGRGWVLPWMGPAHPRHSLQGCLQGRDGSTISNPLNRTPHIRLPPSFPQVGLQCVDWSSGDLAV